MSKMSSIPSNFTLGLCQILVGRNKEENIGRAQVAVYDAVQKGAQVVVLPECFNSPYSTADFKDYAEFIPDTMPADGYKHTLTHLSTWAKELGIYLVGGSIPERDEEGNLYNTSTVWNPEGIMIAKHRKLHLFDIDIPNKMTFKESDSLTAGNKVTQFSMDLSLIKDYVPSFSSASHVVTVGLGICYDIRFSEYAQICVNNGCQLLIYPGAFNLVTGPAHWELLQKCRAIDNQVYVAACSPARASPETEGYKAWGHSSIVSPWGDVVSTTDEQPSIVLGTIDFEKMYQVRQNIPITSQRRYDIYKSSSIL